MVVTLPFRSSSVQLARRRLGHDLRDRGVAEAYIDDATVILSELLANALRHAHPLRTGRLSTSWEVSPAALVVSVSDGGSPAVPRVQRLSPTSLGGRGLAMVEMLSDRWWVDRDTGATTVSAEIRLS